MLHHATVVICPSSFPVGWMIWPIWTMFFSARSPPARRCTERIAGFAWPPVSRPRRSIAKCDGSTLSSSAPRVMRCRCTRHSHRTIDPRRLRTQLMKPEANPQHRSRHGVARRSRPGHPITAPGGPRSGATDNTIAASMIQSGVASKGGTGEPMNPRCRAGSDACNWSLCAETRDRSGPGAAWPTPARTRSHPGDMTVANRA